MQKIMTFFQFDPEQLSTLVSNLVLSLIILLVCFLISKLLKGRVQQQLKKVKKIDPMLVPMISSMIRYVVYFIGAAIILDLFGVSSTSIVTLLGTIGLAIGFALKDTLSNIAAGILLLFLRPFNNGDFIQVGGDSGTVMEVNLFTTVLKNADGIYVSIPNKNLNASTITNFTRNGIRRAVIGVGIGYSDSLDQGLAVLNKIIESESRILKDPTPQTIVVSMGDSSVNLELRAWMTVADYWPTFWDLQKRVKEEIEGAGLSIPFPQRDLNIKQQELPSN